MQDAKQKGRMFTPSYFGFTRQRRIKKLTDSEVMDIYESKESLITLSKRFEVSMSTISHIRTGKRKHLVTGAMRE
jgi:hypothetical protein